MDFKKHSDLEGKHSFLSGSKYHWINYDLEKLAVAYRNYSAAQRGTELHELAKRCVDLKVRLPRTKSTLNMYVNDAIGFHMTTEQPLYYSENCFGQADAISFDSAKNFLRIHDLKTGESPTSMYQLEIYAAIFCLEYGKDPGAIQMELRIYQKDEVLVASPDPEEIRAIMDKIMLFDKEIDKMRAEE